MKPVDKNVDLLETVSLSKHRINDRPKSSVFMTSLDFNDALSAT